MAHRYYGGNQGGHLTDITEGSSTTSKSVELAIDLSAGMSREDVLIQGELILQKIVQDNWPPA